MDDWTLFFDGQLGSAIVMLSLPSFDSLCERADEQLFVKIMKNKQHLLCSLLPQQREQHYKLRDRVHNFQLPTHYSDIFNFR